MIPTSLLDAGVPLVTIIARDFRGYQTGVLGAPLEYGGDRIDWGAVLFQFSNSQRSSMFPIEACF